MSYNPYDRSELELRFEKLFKEVFRCHVEDVLTPQFPLEFKDRYYRIDYAFISDNDRIAIELDGHGKIKAAADSSKAMRDLFIRQNDIVSAGFKVFRFTWDDVVKQNGWRARKQLQQIFAGKLSNKKQSSQYKPEYEVRRGSSSENKSGSSIVPLNEEPVGWAEGLPHNSTTASIIDATPYYPQRKNKIAITIAACILVFVSLIYFLKYQEQPAFDSSTTQIQVDSTLTMPLQTTPIPSPLQKSKPFSQSNQKYEPKVIHAEVPKAVVQPSSPQKPISASAKLLETAKTHQQGLPVTGPNTSTVMPIKEEAVIQPETNAASLDEIVVFNQDSLIYHKPHCYWAKKCTKNCVYVPKSQALSLGGRAAKSCNPR